MPAKLSPRPKTDKAVPLAGRLTAQQELFVEALFHHNFHLKDSAIKAGVSPASASQQSCRWMNMPQVQAAIAKKREFLRNTQEVDGRRIIQELARIAFFNPKRLLGPDGKKPLTLAEMPDDVAAALANIGVTYGEEQDGDGNYHVLKHIRYTPHDKLVALKQLAAMLGLDNGEALKIINNVEINQLVVNWNDLYRKASAELPAHDPIEARILAEESGGGVAPTTTPAPETTRPLNVVTNNDIPSPQET